MNWCLLTLSLFASIYVSYGEYSEKCKPKHVAYQTCIKSWYNYGVEKTVKERKFKERVNKCFTDVKCKAVAFGVSILPNSKKRAQDTKDTVNAYKYTCVRRQMHTIQQTLLSQCTREETGKDASDVIDVPEDLKERRRYFRYTLAIENAKQECPTVSAVCIKDAFSKILSDWCKLFETKCRPGIGPTVYEGECLAEHKGLKEDVCKCRTTISRGKPLRKQNNLLGLGSLVNRLGLNNLLPALRFKRQTNTANIGTLINTWVKAFPKITALGTGSEPSLEELGAEFGLNSNEVNSTMAKCGAKSAELPDTPEKSLILACGCGVADRPDVRKRCLASGRCLGKNYQLYEKAEKTYRDYMNRDHLRFFCDCGVSDLIPSGLIG